MWWWSSRKRLKALEGRVAALEHAMDTMRQDAETAVADAEAVSQSNMLIQQRVRNLEANLPQPLGRPQNDDAPF